VAQEALANIRKHARPDEVEVCLAYQAQTVRLTVRDSGAAGGCRAGAAGPGSAAPAEPAGYGLIGMRERAELLGGTLTAAPATNGFLVGMEVPA
jgi:signal transduction histidine kinase